MALTRQEEDKLLHIFNKLPKANFKAMFGETDERGATQDELRHSVAAKDFLAGLASISHELTREEAKIFTKWYRTNSGWKNLKNKVDNKNDLLPEEIVCFALVTQEVLPPFIENNLSSAQLNSSRLDASIVASLNIIDRVNDRRASSGYYTKDLIDLLESKNKPLLLNLHKAYLKKVTLNWCYLEEANFSEANLSYANLNLSNLKNANFTGALLSNAGLRADLRGANFTGANLTNAYLDEVNMKGADFTGADLTGADLRSTDLSEVILKGAILKDIVIIPLSNDTKFSATNISRALFTLSLYIMQLDGNRELYQAIAEDLIRRLDKEKKINIATKAAILHAGINHAIFANNPAVELLKEKLNHEIILELEKECDRYQNYLMRMLKIDPKTKNLNGIINDIKNVDNKNKKQIRLANFAEKLEELLIARSELKGDNSNLDNKIEKFYASINSDVFKSNPDSGTQKFLNTVANLLSLITFGLMFKDSSIKIRDSKKIWKSAHGLFREKTEKISHERKGEHFKKKPKPIKFSKR